MPDISPAKSILLRISRELQFGVCKHGKPRGRPPQKWREQPCRGKERWESWSKQRVHGFPWLSPGEERGKVFLLLVGFSVITGHESSPCWSSHSSYFLQALHPFFTYKELELVKSLSRVRLFATPWTVAYQAPPSMGFSRQEC